MKIPPSASSLNQSEKKISDILGSIDKSRPLLTASSAAFAPAIFLFFAAMAFPSYSVAKIFELAARNTVKYPGQLNSYVKDQSQFAGGITGIVEFFAGMGAKEFKKGFSLLAELIPAEERSNLKSEEIEELYKGILRYNERNEMVPSGNVKPFEVTNVVAKDQDNSNQSTYLHF